MIRAGAFDDPEAQVNRSFPVRLTGETRILRVVCIRRADINLIDSRTGPRERRAPRRKGERTRRELV